MTYTTVCSTVDAGLRIALDHGQLRGARDRPWRLGVSGAEGTLAAFVRADGEAENGRNREDWEDVVAFGGREVVGEGSVRLGLRCWAGITDFL